MRIPKVEWNDPIRQTYEIAKSKMEQGFLEEFEAAYSRYTQKLSHLSFIWERLCADSDAHEGYLEFLRSRMPQTEVNRPPVEVVFSTQELTHLKQLEEASKTLYLDYEDFFIHSKVLLDRSVFLTRFFFPKTGGIPSNTSFTKHRQFLLRPENIPFRGDEVYAKYIRENTNWFETMLRAYRDNFMVHDVRFRSFGVVSGPTQIPRLFRRRGRTIPPTEWERTWQSLMVLREKYLERIPGFKVVSVNAYEIIDFLDSHASAIDASDLKALGEVRAFAGGKIPDITQLANHIKDYLVFSGQHFYERIAKDN